jgi:hypothetical protein
MRLNKDTSKPFAFEVISKRRKGFPSETRVKRGPRIVGQSLEGSVNGGWVRAAGAGRLCAPAALDGGFWAVPQLLRQVRS